MRFYRRQLVRLCIAPAALGLAIAAGGCGGSGDGGNATPLQITGGLKAASGAALSGYTVSFDNSKTDVATTNAVGAFTLNVPRSDVGGTDTLSIMDPSGVLVDKVSLPAGSSTALSYNAGVLNVAPPPAPFVAR